MMERHCIECRTKHYFVTKLFQRFTTIQRANLITTDGTTLLGADDKAGITEIVTAMEFLIKIQTSNTEKLESVSHLMKKLDVAHTLM
jgi:di/tripeptidase